MKFSILVPAYKPQFLAECIKSILAQTYEDWELIIVNDASPYDLDSIVKKYADKRIRYYTNEANYGAVEMVKNWNHCLEYVTGEYVINMGDDDELTPTCLENYATQIKQHPEIDVFHTRTEMIDESSIVIDIQEVRPEWESVYSMMFHYWRGRRQMMGDWLFKYSTLKKANGYFDLPCACGADAISSFIMAMRTGVININSIGFRYRDSSQTVSNNTKFTLERINAYNKACQWYQSILIKEPDDKLDKTYRMILKKEVSSSFNHRICGTLSGRLSNTPGYVFICLRKSSEIGVKKHEILTLELHALINWSISKSHTILNKICKIKNRKKI